MRLAILSNFSPDLLDAAVRSAGLEGVFDCFSTDREKTYNSDPREDIVFVRFVRWDAAGAKWFG